MVYYCLTTAPALVFVAPPVTGQTTIGEFGTNVNDQIIDEVLPPTYVPLNPNALPEIIYDPDYIRQTNNSINRGQFTAPPVDAPVTIVSNRTKLRSIMATFMFPVGNYYHDGTEAGHFEFVVERRNNLIFFGTLDEDPGEQFPAEPSPKAYGIPFEDLTTVVNPALHGFFRFQSYSLLGVPLIVRSEIDCVNETNQYYELKTKKGRPDGRFPPENDANYMRYIWCQMFLGRAHSLVLGVFNEVEHQQRAQLKSVVRYEYKDVQTRAKVEIIQITRFASLLDWIRDNMNDGDQKTLSYGNENNQRGFRLVISE